jgi:hypothetical protein
MRHSKATLWMVVLVVPVLTAVSSAAVIQNIGGDLFGTDWYHGNGTGGYFQTNYSGTDLPAFINTMGFSTDTANYWVDSAFSMGTFTLGPSALVTDQTPSGGLAKGLFAAGATLTINGDLWTDDFGTLVAYGDLITATVTTQWNLKELPPNAPSNTVDGRAFFHITGGSLSNASLNSEGLVLGDFYLDFLFQSCSPAVTNFSTLLGNNTYYCSHPTIQGGAVPEPASISILGLGGLALIRRRK